MWMPWNKFSFSPLMSLQRLWLGRLRFAFRLSDWPEESRLRLLEKSNVQGFGCSDRRSDR